MRLRKPPPGWVLGTWTIALKRKEWKMEMGMGMGEKDTRGIYVFTVEEAL